MSKSNNSDKFYSRLKAELKLTSVWPSLYLYKFIVPSEDVKINAIKNIFDNMGAIINTRKSSKGKYTSASIEVHMKNPEAVIEKYKEVAKIEGVISL